MNIHGYKIGDIICQTFSYNMTINDFWQVVKTTPKSVTLQKINKKVVKGDPWGPGGGQVAPIKDDFVVNHTRQNRITSRTREDNTLFSEAGHMSKVDATEAAKGCYECHWD